LRLGRIGFWAFLPAGISVTDLEIARLLPCGFNLISRFMKTIFDTDPPRQSPYQLEREFVDNLAKL
jgi:hypothetical protein